MTSPGAQSYADNRAAIVLVGLVYGAVTVGAVVITLGSPIVDHPVYYAALRGLLMAGLLALGLYGWIREPGARYPALLLLALIPAAPAALTGVDEPWLFAIGRIATAAQTVAFIVLLLSYPTGRLLDVASRRLAVAAAAGSAVFLTASLLFSPEPPIAGPFVRCADDCPENPLAIVDGASAIGRASTAALGLTVVLAALGTAFLLARRMRSATALEQRSISPVLTWSVLVTGSYAVYVAARVIDSDVGVLGAIGAVVAATIALIPVSIAVALARGRVFAAGALRRTVAGLGDQPSPARLRAALADAFRDPSLQLVFWLPDADTYVDELGHRAELPEPGATTALTRFDRDGRPIAAAIHDRALSEDAAAPLASAGEVILLALENARLEAELRARLSELRVSRARLVSIADAERRRIERDLHDGAQQHLVALSIQLSLLGQLADNGSPVATGIAEAVDGIEVAMEQIRELAHGIYPPALRYDGLEAALVSAARRLPLRIGIDADGLDRVAPVLESAAYFCCLEALQNVAKHAEPQTRVRIHLAADDGVLRFSVADEGPGFDPAAVRRGDGLTGMRDRIGAIGGDLEIVSAPGRGTTIRGRVPLDAT
ncbi:MAG: sensor histidine kinase [Solirubrobacteraceae bacterium]